MSERCITCRFYDTSGEWRPVCRRFPPTPNPDGNPDWWPQVLESDWCGEYQPRPAATVPRGVVRERLISRRTVEMAR